MPEQVQKILDKIMEWWKKFNTKQRMIMISATACVLLALIILAVVLSQPTMVPLITCDSTSQAGEVKDLLEGNDVSYQLSDDGLTFEVNEKDKANAAILLGTNNIPAEGYDISSVFDGGFSSTEADKTKKYKVYLEKHFAESLETFSNVESASVRLDLPDDDGTILSKDEQASATAILTLSDDMDEDQAYGVAQFMATNLGNDNTDNILIMDSNSNVLYSGSDSSSTTGTANTQLSLKVKAENQIKDKVKEAMQDSSLYDSVEIATNLDMNFDEKTEATHEYYAPDGMTTGMPSSVDDYSSTSQGGAAAEPGTGSNDDTTYMIDNSDYTSSEVTENKTNYQNNEKVTETKSAVGTINYDTSSISIVATNYVIYDEDTLKKSGALDGMTFDEYVAANSNRVKTDVDDDYYNMVATATGFSRDNITIIAYDEPVFQYSSGSGRTLSDYLQIALAVIIFALLGFVVFRSTRKEKEAELEPELSVENLLEATKENQDSLEDIGFNEKSETRILIEKFVDENPEAVASLLRNWLNEDWE